MSKKKSNGDEVQKVSDDPGTIYAAGCVVYRKAKKGAIEVLVVHRPRYDDWDFPKGKRERGETDLDCALRETKEETGFSGEVGMELKSSHYEVRGKPKVIRWWLLEQTGGAFSENDEVDKIRWLSLEEANAKVSYRDTQQLLDTVGKHFAKKEAQKGAKKEAKKEAKRESKASKKS